MIQKKSSDSFDQFGSAMKDGRLTEPSNEKNFDLHKTIELSKKLGRPLNESEIAQFAV